MSTATFDPATPARTMQPETRAFVYGMIGVPLLLLAALFGCYERGSGMLLTGVPGSSGIAGGFCANILMSIAAMAVSLCTGMFLCAGTIANGRIVRLLSLGIVNLLRNTPWLIALRDAVSATVLRVGLQHGDSVFTVRRALAVGHGERSRRCAAASKRSRAGSGNRRARSGSQDSNTTFFSLYSDTALYRRAAGGSDLHAQHDDSLRVPLHRHESRGRDRHRRRAVVANTITASDGSHYATAVQLYVMLLFFLFSFPIATLSRRLERQIREKS